MLKFKHDPNGCRIQGVESELILGLLAASLVYTHFDKDCIVTSITDSKHMSGSLHYIGHAADLAIPSDLDLTVLMNNLQECLGEEWDVVKESNHIHIEFQPKKGLNL